MLEPPRAGPSLVLVDRSEPFDLSAFCRVEELLAGVNPTFHHACSPYRARRRRASS
jgi:hypothetical protein